MLSKAVIDIPYICKEPLSSDTTWLAIPVLVSSKNKELTAAFQKVNTVMGSMPEILNTDSAHSFTANLLDFDATFDDLQANMEFLDVNDNEFKVRLYNYVIIKFPNKGLFLEKMKFISETLDKLHAFVKDQKSDKNTSVRLGERYRFVK